MVGMSRDKIGLIAVAIVLLALAWILASAVQEDAPEPTSFEECMAAGYPVAESYPRQCSTGAATFVEAVADRFATPPECVVAGCSNELCVESVEAPYVVTTCLYQESFACLAAFSRCERQPNGRCEWTPGEELNACLSDPAVHVPESTLKEVI